MAGVTAIAVSSIFAAGLTIAACGPSASPEQSASSTAVARRQGEIRWTCGAGDECAVEAILPDGRHKEIFNGVVRSPGVRRLDDRVSEFRMSCGSPCSASIFVDFRDARVSEPVENVVAADPKQMVVASAGMRAIEVRLMFGDAGPHLTISRNFARVATLVSAIREATFLANGGLRLRYLRDPDYQEEEAIVPLDLKALQPRP